jgi:hypothetical protein
MDDMRAYASDTPPSRAEPAARSVRFCDRVEHDSLPTPGDDGARSAQSCPAARPPCEAAADPGLGSVLVSFTRPELFTGGHPDRVRAGHGWSRPLADADQQCWKACWGRVPGGRSRRTSGHRAETLAPVESALISHPRPGRYGRDPPAAGDAADLFSLGDPASGTPGQGPRRACWPTRTTRSGLASKRGANMAGNRHPTRLKRWLKHQVRTGAPPGTRTPNPRIKSPLLCQLS